MIAGKYHMVDSIFSQGRTRSQLTLPEAPIELSRSPLKDARLAVRNRSRLELEGAEAETKRLAGKNEMDLSPPKLGDKRSPSPATTTDWPILKRFKTSPTGSDAEHSIAQKPVHSRHFSDSNILAKARRKRSATSKPKSSSSSSTRHQAPAILPSKKERASSVPVFPSFRDVPRVDIRDFPTSPTRRPLHSREPNLRITFGSLFPLSKALESIPDEASSDQDATNEPARDVPIVTLSEIPATPTQTDRLVPTDIHAAPLSPLTPLSETPLFKKLVEADANTEDRFAASDWGQSNEVSQNNGQRQTIGQSSAIGPGVPAKHSRSRLPRSTNGTASSSRTKSYVTEQVVAPVKAASAESGVPVKQKTNAFDLMMRRTEKDNGKEKAVTKGKAKTPDHSLGVSAGKFRENGKVIQQKKGSDVKGKGRSGKIAEVQPSNVFTIKGKMKPRTKPEVKTTIIPSVVLDDEDEDPPSSNRGMVDSPTYPLQPLPTQISPPPLDFGGLPPKSSSPLVSTNAEERIKGVDEATFTMDDMKGDMKGDNKIYIEGQPVSLEKANTPAVIEIHQIQIDVEPRVPSPLFSEPPTTAPSPLFSEPSSRADEDSKNQKYDQHMKAPHDLIDGAAPVCGESIELEIISDSPQAIGTESSSITSPRSQRQKVVRPPPPSRTTRSASSMVLCTEPDMAASGSAKKPLARSKRASKSAIKAGASSKAEADASSTASSSSTNCLVPTEPRPVKFSAPQFPVFNDDDDSSELSDLPKDYMDEEVPLKGDGGEDMEMETPQAAQSSTATKTRRKTLGTEIRTSPRRKSLRGLRSDEDPPDERSASFPSVQSSQSSLSHGKSHLARSTSSTKIKNSVIPGHTTPFRKSTISRSPAPKDTRPGSAPSSPTKLKKSYTMFSYVPVMPRLINSDTSVLGRLDHALAALAKPPPAMEPSRPNTSMGFNRDDPDSSIVYGGGRINSVPEKGRGKSIFTIGIGRPSTSKTSASGFIAQASSSKSTTSAFASSKVVAQSQLSQFLPPGTGPGLQKNKPAAIMRGGRPLIAMSGGTGNRFPVGGSLGSRGKKASQKTTLPSVVASPVKGGGGVSRDDDIEMVDGDVTMFDISMSGNRSDMNISELEVSNTSGSRGKGKERESEDSSVMSRHNGVLSQSLSALPDTTFSMPIAGSMGPPPPPTSPPRRAGLRSSSSSYPSSTISKPQAPPKFVPESTVLEGCTVFVDVWMSDGQDTSSIYMDIAKDLGARIVKRIGPQCTHIVYTAGRERTVEQYFALNETKRPKTVGASWLRDCKQADARLDEERYLVDLEEHKPEPMSNTFFFQGDKSKRHKRRQSFIPKFCGTDDNGNEDEDMSVDGSNASMVDDELTPLERARLRQSTAGSSQRK
ncbi:hypothetical protein F5050DRAFT_1169584 [Lentinula boryana]|uniref:BRCT domain-containing protein n=1 Tax=Lentinula boryana TaxID=40481 RepID=A0ABQ8QJR3_9AGAR|nr:hypothetical protein F5050DRAFT_1169584 [Lentinula boryana]